MKITHNFEGHLYYTIEWARLVFTYTVYKKDGSVESCTVIEGCATFEEAKSHLRM